MDGKLKYTGLFNALKTVYQEEGKGAGKFLSGLQPRPRFMFNLFNGVMFLFIYDRFNQYIDGVN